jgi:uncharacterized protein (TIGR02246 family)
VPPHIRSAVLTPRPWGPTPRGVEDAVVAETGVPVRKILGTAREIGGAHPCHGGNRNGEAGGPRALLKFGAGSRTPRLAPPGGGLKATGVTACRRGPLEEILGLSGEGHGHDDNVRGTMRGGRSASNLRTSAVRRLHFGTRHACGPEPASGGVDVNSIPRTPYALALLSLLVSCSPAGPGAVATVQELLSDAEASAIVDSMIAEWDARANSGDTEAEAAAAMYTPDAVRLQPGMPALEGRDAIRAWLQTEGEAYIFEGSNEIVEVRALAPDWIMMRTTGSFTATPRVGGEAVTMREQWLTLVQRQADGSWLWYRDAGNDMTPR